MKFYHTLATLGVWLMLGFISYALLLMGRGGGVAGSIRIFLVTALPFLWVSALPGLFVGEDKFRMYILTLGTVGLGVMGLILYSILVSRLGIDSALERIITGASLSVGFWITASHFLRKGGVPKHLTWSIAGGVLGWMIGIVLWFHALSSDVHLGSYIWVLPVAALLFFLPGALPGLFLGANKTQRVYMLLAAITVPILGGILAWIILIL